MDSDSTIAVTPGTANTTLVAGQTDPAGNFQQKVILGDTGMASMHYHNALTEAILIELQNHSMLLQSLIDNLRQNGQLDF